MLKNILKMLLLFSTQCTMAQNVGIGTSTPTGPLSFGTEKGPFNRTILFRNNTFGIVGTATELSFSSGPDVQGSIVFGQGNSTAFTPVMRIQPDGNVGIGVAQATQKLDVAGRIRSRYSNTSLTPGIVHSYYDQRLNLLPVFFTGMFDLYSIGMAGGGKGVLRVDGRNGALGLDFNYGFAGQIAVSNGNTNTANWQNNSDYGHTFNNMAYRFESNGYTLTDKSPSATLSSFTIPFALAKSSKIFVDYSIAANTTACFSCPSTYFRVNVSVNGVQITSTTFEVGNGRSTTAVDGMLMDGGTNFTVSVVVVKLSGPTLTLPVSAGRTSSITICPIAQN